MADGTYMPKVYRKQGGDEFVVASGGKINVESGGQIDDDAIVAAINSLKDALVGAGIMAAS